MTRRRLILCVVSVIVCASLIAFIGLPGLRRAIAVPIVGQARLHGSMHLNTPIEDIHHWLAPPILRD
jgi:hypothetical protein